jgi:hypothetical protein
VVIFQCAYCFKTFLMNNNGCRCMAGRKRVSGFRRMFQTVLVRGEGEECDSVSAATSESAQ